MTISQLRDLFVKSYRRWAENDGPRMAASLAFYAILALAPMLLFAVAVGSQFLDSGSLRETLLREARAQLGAGASDLFRSMLDSASRPGASTVAGVVSIVLALFGASGLFIQLRLSVNNIWGVGPRTGNPIREYLAARLLAVLMALAFMTVILAWISLDSVVGYMRHLAGRGYVSWHLVSFVVSVAFLTGAFALTFKSFPRGMVAWRDVWLPAFLTAFAFAIAKYLLSLYFGLGGVGAAYGPAGALVVVLIWLYYSAQIFFFGVELTVSYAYSVGSHKEETIGELEMS
ncbi:MAG TPA: YihY/virulence factor BrkB family protein [Fimbriimonadaceae bacterium]|nr:YihY/virulence factor BrkB family protein [Fimbriimonadaceae bacterium]